MNHKNGNKTDNRVENLEWCTHLENMRHAITTLRHTPWMKASLLNRKFNKLEISKIRSAYKADGVTYKKLAQKFNVSASTIWKIITNKTYFYWSK